MAEINTDCDIVRPETSMASYRLGDQAEPWQRKSFAETNLHMLGNEIMCDVTFLAGKNKELVRAHKFMLASRSPVFYAMFCGPFSESKDDTITVPDIESNILRNAIQFVYTDDCTCSEENVTALLYVSQKYDVEGLIKKCSQFLKDHMETGNVCTILQQAMIYNQQDLVDECLAFIEDNGRTVLQTENLKLLNKEELLKIIQLDNLYVEEENVYKACVDWAKHKCMANKKDVNEQNTRECLGEVLYMIRFPIMKIEKFSEVVAKDSVLSSEEKLEVFKSYGGIVEPSPKFPAIPRNYQGNMIVVKIFRSIVKSLVRTSITDTLSFGCSSDVKFAGVSFFTPDGVGSAEGPLEILEDDQTIYKTHVKLAYYPSKQYVNFFLKRTIKIIVGKEYTIKQTLRGHSTYSGQYGLPGLANMGDGNFVVNFIKLLNDKNVACVNSDKFYRLILRRK